MKKNLKSMTSTALKWSTLGEFFSKLVTPISNMILARILTPESFGIVATVTMIISFADTLSDSGFQKYLIQKNFKNQEKINKATNVAFTSNLIFSLILYLIIILLNKNLAALFGNNGKGSIFIVAGVTLIITAFSSIYSAILKRNFEFKKLFFSRIAITIVPILVTVPLALLGYDYWSIIIGNILGNIVSMFIMKKISKINLKILFDIHEFKEMLSFSLWSLIESLGTWLTSYVGTFIVGIYLNSYYLGLYKTTITNVNGIFAIITTATTSVLFSLLSKLQNDKQEYDKTFLKFINTVSILIIPIGGGIFIFKDLVTTVLLGSKWIETTDFIGIYGLLCSVTLVFGQYCSEYFRGLGKPKYNVLMTFLHLVVLIPALIYGSSNGFVELSYWRSLIKIEQILVFWFIMKKFCKFKPINIIKASQKSIISSLIMIIIGYLIKQISSSILFDVIAIIICIIVYFCSYIFILNGGNEIKEMFYMFTGKGGNVSEK